jgi:putative nucleotidyltransferase with HDIG domain
MLMTAFDNEPKIIIYPMVDGHRGHPPLIRQDLIKAIRSHDGHGGLRTVLDRVNSNASTVHLADEGVMLDMDTPEDVRSLSVRLTQADRLTENECRLLMEDVCQVPDAVVTHCRIVARVTLALAEAVNKSGGTVNIPLARSAALVHDLVKGEKNHADTGALLLKKMGFPAMAAIIATHMEMDVSDNSPVDAAQIVHLADKLVAGETVADLSQQFNAKLEKFGGNPEVAEKIVQRQLMALKIQNKVEQTAGVPIPAILHRAGLI